MEISKSVLDKLKGLNPCSSTVTFTPSEYDSLLDDESMEGFIPSFTTKSLTVEQVSSISEYIFNGEKKSHGHIKGEILGLLDGVIVDWKNMVNLTTGEIIEFTPEGVEQLTEVVLDSILAEVMIYAGFIPRKVRDALTKNSSD